MDHLGEELLAGARLAEQEHGRVGRRDGAHLLDRTLERRGGTDDLAERELAVEPRAEDGHLLLGRAGLEAALQQQLDLPEVDGLLQEPIGAAAHRLNGGVDVAVGGHHDADGLLR